MKDTSSPHRSLARRLTLLTSSLALLSIPLAIVGCNQVAASTEPAALPLPVVAVVASEQDHYTITQSFAGVVRSRRDSRLGFERGGLVAQVNVEEGDRVRPGQVVAVLDTSKLVAERRRLVAQRSEVDAGLGIAKLTAERLTKLQAERFASTQERDEAQFSLRRTAAQRETLDAAIASLDVELRMSRLVTPYAGTVAARLVDEGTVVAPGSQVVRYLDEASPEAVVGVPITVASSLSVGSRQRVALDDGRVLEAVVIGQNRDVDSATRTTEAIFELPVSEDDGTDAALRDGQIVRLLHEQRVADRGFWLPRTALTEGLRGLWSTYGIQDDGGQSRIVRHEVEVLHTDGERVFVRGTLRSGDRLVRGGLHRVVPGQAVTVAAAPGVSEVEP